MKKVVFLSLVWITSLLCSCSSSTLNVSPQRQPVSFHARWGIIPFSNHTQTPQAGQSAAAITSALLETRGVMSVTTYEVKASKDQLLLSIENIPMKDILRWARRRRLRYIISGSINEWQYKVGLDGEPVVNVALQLIDVRSGRTIWTAVGSRTGGSRSGLTVVAQKLIESMLISIR